MDLVSLIQDGSVSAIYLVALGLVIGALHGLEPGHSKTMMAAFIIAVRGSVFQAVLLGISAAFSHSIIVWILGFAALKWGADFSDENTEPYFLIASGVIILLLAAWMIFTAWRDTRKARQNHDHGHHHHHDHDHGHPHAHPHHDHAHGPSDKESMDAHQRYHADQIESRFAGREVTTPQIIMFGLTGGLLPCAAAVTVLILCIQLQKFWLGFALVSSFSAGLAITLVVVGVVAAWGANKASKKFSGLDRWAKRLPYLSSGLVAVIGIFMLTSGYKHLT